MIKKLRARFTFVLTGLLALVMLGVLASIFISMYRSEEHNAQRIIDFAINIDYSGRWENPPPPGEDTDTPPKEISERPDGKNRIQMSSGWITVKLDSENEIQSIFYSRERFFSSSHEMDVQSSYVTAAAQEIISRTDKDNGTISAGGTSYRYKLRDTESGKMIVLLDRTDEISTLRRLMFILLGIFVLALGVIFLLSILLSKWAVIPIEDAWNRQRVFFSNASHELKTPLTVINANLDVITSNPDDTVAGQGKWFGYIRCEAEKMSRLINEMLYLSREERTDNPPVMSELDLSEAAEGACLAMEALAFERGKEISSDIDSGITVKGDKEALLRMINILIDNAVSHSSEHSEISVSLKKSRKNKVKLTVSNKGTPIPPEELDRIFDRYYRTDASRSGSTGGFGLGLAIAKTIAEKHGGSIAAESDEDRTAFTVTLNLLS
ncbi:MAG: ATP-binding protein [Huintestinicola sp.]|uniref:ATP-binding protein n=1 Tax=Huintestinicola sp. TaxID=2981661 RepID=UPI003F070F58